MAKTMYVVDVWSTLHNSYEIEAENEIEAEEKAWDEFAQDLQANGYTHYITDNDSSIY